MFYKKHRQTGLSFKGIKQHLKVKSFRGHTENAVKIQIYCVINCGRHTSATLALTKGVSIESVGKIPGHTKIKTTSIYAMIDVRNALG